MSFYIVGNFISIDLVISFCLNAMYWGGGAFASLLIDVSNVFIEKKCLIETQC